MNIDDKVQASTNNDKSIPITTGTYPLLDPRCDWRQFQWRCWVMEPRCCRWIQADVFDGLLARVCGRVRGPHEHDTKTSGKVCLCVFVVRQDVFFVKLVCSSVIL